MDKTSFLKKMETKHPKVFSLYDYDLLADKFTTDSKISIRCRQHGVFLQRANDHLKGYGCTQCKATKQRKTQDEFIFEARRVHGDRYGYQNSSYVGREEELEIHCPDHGSFYQLAKSHLEGSGCSKCYGNGRGSKESFEHKARLVHGDTYDYSEVIYVNDKSKVKIVCRVHGVYEQRPNTHLQGSGCPYCKESKGELKIRELLESNGIIFAQEYRIFPDLYRFDFFLTNQNILIEFHGIQHYAPVKWFGGQSAFLEQCHRDAEKVLLAKEKNIPLITLNYRQLDSGVLEKSLIRELKNVYKFWFLYNGRVEVFRNGRELATFFKVPHCYIDRVVLEAIETAHPTAKLLLKE